MNGLTTPQLDQITQTRLIAATSPAADVGAAAAALVKKIAVSAPALTLVFTSPGADLNALGRALSARQACGDLPGAVIGCTTAGELNRRGYDTDTITTLSFPATSFTAAVELIHPLTGAPLADVAALARRARAAVDAPDAQLFGVLLADGLSRSEECLATALAAGLGDAPLLGGSAADAMDFQRSYVLADGAFHADAAVLAVVRSTRHFEAFSISNFAPTDVKMVVTAADMDQRRVLEINAEPAAAEYARLIGVAPEELTPTVFAANPVMVRVGGAYHVRAIQRADSDGSLAFYCAIDEGLVMTLGTPQDIAANLEAELGALRQRAGPAAGILAFDCILRRIEAERAGQSQQVSEILRRHGVSGFSTYGEQFRYTHVNQTFTGVYVAEAEALP